MKHGIVRLILVVSIPLLIGCSSIKAPFKEAWFGEVPPEERAKREQKALDGLSQNFEKSLSGVELINTTCSPITVAGEYEKPIGYQDEMDAQGIPETKILKKVIQWQVDLGPGEKYQIKIPTGKRIFNCEPIDRICRNCCPRQTIDLPKMLLGYKQVLFGVSGVMPAQGSNNSIVIFTNPWRNVTYVVKGHKLVLGARVTRQEGDNPISTLPVNKEPFEFTLPPGQINQMVLPVGYYSLNLLKDQTFLSPFVLQIPGDGRQYGANGEQIYGMIEMPKPSENAIKVDAKLIE